MLAWAASIFIWSGMAHAAPNILVFGDSLSAAYGIAANRGWVTLLVDRLKRERLDYSVVNASISGETTAGGLARLGRMLETHRPAVVLLELGANDGLRGLPVAAMKKNLGAMILMGQKAGAKVLLVGMRLPPNYGPQYTNAFDGAFAEVAKAHKAGLVPFLFEGFGDRRELFLEDRIHPNEQAQPLLLENVWKGLRPLLGKR
ncbi:MAG: arylesterase [Betaproteobacteria bacterium]|nr:arylesterase [Betaproteobacteria bacterium]MBM3383567.1 arylesterase [Betaproteobacteria bacterium]